MIPNGRTLFSRSFFKMAHAQYGRIFLSSNIEILYTIFSYFLCWTTFYITLSSENVRITCYLTKKWPTFGVFSKKILKEGIIFHIYQEQIDAICLSSSFLFYNLKIRKEVKYVSVVIVVIFHFFVFFLFDTDALRNGKIRNYKEIFC